MVKLMFAVPRPAMRNMRILAGILLLTFVVASITYIRHVEFYHQPHRPAAAAAATVKFTLPKTLIDHEELKSSLVPPCKFGCYNLDNPKKAHFSQFPDQKEVIEELFANEENRYFVEAGAFDGETFSNTLWLERHLGWTGLLVEPSPIAYAKLEGKLRKSWLAPMCLSPTTLQAFREFDENTESPELSAISGALAKAKPEEKVDDVDQSKIRRVKVFCVPLGDLVRALAWTRIDFLSLDAEGSDLDILRTVPWQLVDVRVIMVEKGSPPHAKKIRQYLASVGFDLYRELNVDYVFVNKKHAAAAGQPAHIAK
jgi:FkbM family methyltransferase